MYAQFRLIQNGIYYRRSDLFSWAKRVHLMCANLRKYLVGTSNYLTLWTEANEEAKNPIVLTTEGQSGTLVTVSIEMLVNLLRFANSNPSKSYDDCRESMEREAARMNLIGMDRYFNLTEEQNIVTNTVQLAVVWHRATTTGETHAPALSYKDF